MKRSLAAGAVLSATALLTGVIQVSTAAQATPTPSVQAQAAEHRAGLIALANGETGPLTKALGLGGKETLVAKDAVVDADGTRHLRFERTYAGLPVLGGDLVVHQAAGGAVEAVDKAVAATIAVPSLTPSIPADKAAAQASGAVASSVGIAADKDESPLAEVHRAGAAELVVWAADGNPRLAYRTTVQGVRADGTPSSQLLVTDAASGEVLSTHEQVQTATGTGKGVFVGSVPLTTTKSGSTYQLKDASRGGQSTSDLKGRTTGSGTLFTDADNAWGDGTAANRQSAAVDAQFGAAATWDFYKNTFGRSGIKNNGVGATSRVHYGRNYVNAFWDDSCFCMTYGDGSGNTNPLTALDVAGHEMTHGVTSATAGLNYSGESGGLNEATSDIFGTMVEWSANLPADKPDYLIGEEIDINGDGTPLRYMDKPSKDGGSADAWSSSVGGLDVHYSSGVGNHFFYLLAEGSGAKTVNGVAYNSPTSNGSTLTGIGRDKAAAIWYRALTVYFTSTTNYKAARTGTLSAAKDLYGAGSTEYNAVAAAWSGVNVN
ncbi:M4 family metallopeptidase [Kitasatospora purpeofusca]|uniref:M4 family metallopeptidase n=1 Tax=Kitasatospora purpeofusca TaxID=67352 RepID=UPI002254B504|nr:M4 family metallopeptidase [Kitasatospora purpeofusca]MCX4754946.1 M4 family metallopeptidase [Kitasatospora purpeofusca]WSR34329.1 M4 family metallopeptidase [Kitasatospora purpeofusca]WSR42553.1 M4 family metallopeptidase [Kitasatospora purpeofusca]